jgi:hypothetical protein
MTKILNFRTKTNNGTVQVEVLYNPTKPPKWLDLYTVNSIEGLVPGYKCPETKKPFNPYTPFRGEDLEKVNQYLSN